MTSSVHNNTNLVHAAEQIASWSRELLDGAPLSATQREDMSAVHDAAVRFQSFAQSEMAIIQSSGDPHELQRIRHQLRNYLNIVVGFSRLIVRDLPDNLLLHMTLVRDIHDTGEMLMVQVGDIR